MDVKDILGVSRERAEKPEKVEKPKAPKMERPKGMSREAFALLGDSHPIIATQLVPPKKEAKLAKPKPSTKGIVTWQYVPFHNSARTDGFQLHHWSKRFKDAAGRIRDSEDNDYYWAKFNKKASVLMVADELQLLCAAAAAWFLAHWLRRVSQA
jgi:DNA methyltransferase 1-associated protein 1